MATEKELDLALAAALRSDPDFLAWFVSHTKFANAGVTFLSCRADHPWGTHPYRFTNDLGQEATVSRQSETDVLLLLKDSAGRTVAVHIENKIGLGKFTKDQAQMYPQRAAHWLGDPRHGGYEDFDLVLVAPEAFQERNAEQAARFPVFIAHETLGRHLPLFARAGAVS